MKRSHENTRIPEIPKYTDTQIMLIRLFENKDKLTEMENLIKRITIDPEVCHGKPVIRGLRYPVENMLELMAAGMTIEELLIDYPDFEKDDIPACLEYASKLVYLYSVLQASIDNWINMAVLSMFYGIIISMYYFDNRQHHLPYTC